MTSCGPPGLRTTLYDGETAQSGSNNPSIVEFYGVASRSRLHSWALGRICPGSAAARVHSWRARVLAEFTLGLVLLAEFTPNVADAPPGP